MAYPRIDGIVARDSNTAVIFRRGPSKLTQQLLWNLDTDEVAPGQWIRGRVYTRRCDVSPDGKHLVAAITNYSSKQRPKQISLEGEDAWMTCGWTAISRVPYFSAIGLWFSGGAWNGGGIWNSNQEVALNNFAHAWKEAKRPRTIATRKLNLPPSENEPIYSMLLKKRVWIETQELKTSLLNPGWREAGLRLLGMLEQGDFSNWPVEAFEDVFPRHDVVQKGVWKKRHSGGVLVRIDHYNREQWMLCDTAERVVREWKVPQFGSAWLDVDKNGRVIFADQGCLWAWRRFPEGDPELVADLNSNTFSEVAPPQWALNG